MSDGFSRRLQQVIARSKRRAKFDSAVILVSVKAKAEPKKVLTTFESVLRCEDTLGLVSDSVIGIVLEDLRHVSDPLRVGRRLKEIAEGQTEGCAVVCDLASFKKAELALGQAFKTLEKAKKGNQCLYSDKELGSEAESRLTLEADLEVAVNAGELVSYYQPIFNLARGTITGFEALVRWHHPEHGLLLPGSFLEIAEQRGFLLKIDEFVLKDALRIIPIWNEHSDRPIYVSINLASDHFLKAANLVALIKTLKAHPNELNLLRIDVSEQVLFEDDGVESLKTLDMLRIGFNLDDFGVDSESFHCLGSFPFHALKIDRTLIAQMEDEVNAELIVAVLRIAKKMGMKTIAEGVVTHAQLEELRNLGCTEAQGFLFSEAVDEKEAGTLIDTEYRW